MKSNRCIFIIVVFLGLTTCNYAQNSGIEVSSKLHDYGSLENICTLESEFIIKNLNAKKLFVLRADAGREVKVRITKKAIEPGDTATLTFVYEPKQTGKFNEQVNLVTSADAEPFVLGIRGIIKSLKNDDKTACYYFGKPHKNLTEPVVISVPVKPTSPTVNKPVQATTNEETQGDTEVVNKPHIVSEPVSTVTDPRLLDKDLYKPNNVVFLVDVSGSMRDSLKLPLMKEALYSMIDAMRENDRVTFITYSDTVKTICEAVPGNEKTKLKSVVSRLKTKGYTKGAKAILYSLDVALENYIPEGNNQIFLSTDGKFTFYEGHYRQWTEKQGNKKIVLSTVCFGNDKEAIKNLKEISEKGKGSFIRIKNYKQTDSFLEEIKFRSKK